LHDDDIDDTVIRPSRAQNRHDHAADALDDTVIRPARSTGPEADATDATDDTVIRPVRSSGPATDATDVSDDTVIRPARSTEPATDVTDDTDYTVVRDRPRTPEVSSVPDVPQVPGADGAEDTIVRPAARPQDQGEPTGGAEPRLPSVPTARVPSVRIGDRVIRLDRPVVIGRRPSPTRFERGPQPELVTVPSPRGEVSSSHLRVHAEGEATVVEDLRSTNGTLVRPAGAAPFRMAAGGANVVLTGTVVEIGDGNVIEVLSPHLRVASSAGDLPPFPAWPNDPPAHGTPRTPRERS
jgi:pSer/pThr/pTyr-binding forkhead associated (FHA) protein